MAVRLLEGATRRRLRRARAFIEARHADPVDLGATVESAGLSPYHFRPLAERLPPPAPAAAGRVRAAPPG